MSAVDSDRQHPANSTERCENRKLAVGLRTMSDCHQAGDEIQGAPPVVLETRRSATRHPHRGRHLGDHGVNLMRGAWHLGRCMQQYIVYASDACSSPDRVCEV